MKSYHSFVDASVLWTKTIVYREPRSVYIPDHQTRIQTGGQCPGQFQHPILFHPSFPSPIMSSFLGIESSHDLSSTDGLSGRTGSFGGDVSSLPGGWTASSNPDESNTKVSTDDPKGDLTETTGPPQHLGTFGRTGGVTGLWRSYDPNHPTTGGGYRQKRADKAEQSISSPPKKPESAGVEEQPTSKTD
jgi:hypothetical protein